MHLIALSLTAMQGFACMPQPPPAALGWQAAENRLSVSQQLTEP